MYFLMISCFSLLFSHLTATFCDLINRKDPSRKTLCCPIKSRPLEIDCTVSNSSSTTYWVYDIEQATILSVPEFVYMRKLYSKIHIYRVIERIKNE